MHIAINESAESGRIVHPRVLLIRIRLVSCAAALLALTIYACTPAEPKPKSAASAQQSTAHPETVRLRMMALYGSGYLDTITVNDALLKNDKEAVESMVAQGKILVLSQGTQVIPTVASGEHL